MAGAAERVWLESSGFSLCQEYLAELRAKGLSRIYISNFEFIPAALDKDELCRQLNLDSGDWHFFVEDTDVVAQIRKN